MFRDNRVADICPENLCQQLCINLFPRLLSTVLCKTKPPAATNVLPCMSHFSAFGNRWDRWTSLAATIFQDNHSDDICPEKTVPTEKAAPTALNWALPKPFPRLECCVAPCQRLRKLFARFHLRPACCLAPSQRNSPQAICTVSSPSSMLYRSVPCCLSPSQRSFPQAICPACYLAPSQRSCPRAISTGFPIRHAVSFPPSEALRKLFARFPLRPACCLAPSAKLSASNCTDSSPVQHAVSLHPTEALRKPFSTVSSPSSMLARFLPAKLSASYFHGFLSVQHAVSLPPSEALRKLFPRFPLRPACCLASLPAKLSESYLHGFETSMLSRSLPANLSASYFHHFLSVQHAISLPPSEAVQRAISTVSYPSSMLARSLPAKLSAMLFARLPFRPACCLATACNARCFIFNVYSKSAKEQLAITSFCLDLRASMNTCGFHMWMSGNCNCLDWSACHPCAVAMQLCSYHGVLVVSNHQSCSYSFLTARSPQLFAWQAWHLATSAFTLRGRRGTWLTLTSTLAGVALGDICLHFAWHLATSTSTLRGRCDNYGIWWHAWFPVESCGQPRLFPWQAWRLATSTCILRGRRAFTSLGWLWWLLSHTHTHHFVTQNSSTQLWSQIPFTHNFVTQAFHTQLCHTQLSHTHLCHTQLFHTTLLHAQLCHIHLFHTQSFTHNFVTYNSFTHNTFTSQTYTLDKNGSLYDPAGTESWNMQIR